MDYPPKNVEEIEEQKVIENLKRWEQAERQRRKEVRESRNTELASATTVIGDVARRASLMLWSNNDKTRKRRSRRSTKDYTLSSSGADIEERTSISSLNHSGVETPSRKISGELERTPVKDTTPTQTHYPSLSQSSIDSTTTVTQATNPFGSSAEVNIITPQEQPLMKASSADPFATGPPSPQGSDGEMDITSPTTPTAANVSKSGRPVLQVRQSTYRDANGVALKPPTPRPFDIPPPKTPPPPFNSDEEDVEELEMEQQEQQRRAEARGGVEQDAHEEPKRWWTDWICGCNEGRDRGGERQAASTNPME
jgi:hypothetical protein